MSGPGRTPDVGGGARGGPRGSAARALAAVCCVWILGACAPLRLGAKRPDPPALPACPPCSEEFLLPEAYGELLALIEGGRLSEARERLAAGAGSGTAEPAPAAAVFEAAAALLAERTDAGRLKGFREVFQRYASSLPPEGPARGQAERVLRLLDLRIREAERERKRTSALHEFVERQQKELEELEYKLRRLEEIQQETELKREEFLHK